MLYKIEGKVPKSRILFFRDDVHTGLETTMWIGTLETIDQIKDLVNANPPETVTTVNGIPYEQFKTRYIDEPEVCDE